MLQSLNPWFRKLPVWAVWLLGMIPMALLVWDTVTGGLGIDPVRDIEHRLGRTALYFLLATLLVSPLMRVGRLNLMRFRQALGLICFSYALCHVLSWIVFDMGFLWSQMLRDVIKRPYLIFGMLGFVMLLALAITSNRYSIRRLGGNWRRLHRLIYPAVILGAVHWLWALKVWELYPLVILVFGLVLVCVRLPGVYGILGRKGRAGAGS